MTYRRRNRRLFGAHVVHDSPAYGKPRRESLPQSPGFLGETRSRATEMWGGHCGDLRPLERITPVLREPIPALLASFGASYVLLDEAFAKVADLRLADARPEWRGGSFVLLTVPGRAPVPDQ